MRPKLAKYQVLGALASGGMADVWLAKVSGPAGFDKLVVVKTIRPGLAQEPGFVDMFFNEARVAAALNHPNCVQIFDVGSDEGTAYIAMEFIDGFSLGRLLKRASDRQRPVPLPVVVRIVMDAAAGLEYAHGLADLKGKPMRLVHRDVSLDNILVSFVGQTKVVDFGIAKALTAQSPTESTRTGTVKGKHGYMAPEYLLGKAIDGRADLFGLGVVLYRITTGSRPFSGPTDASITNAVLHFEPVPPRKVNPELPPAVEAVVLRALRKDPSERFENARAMRKALERSVDRPADADDVAAYMSTLWPPGDRERSAVQALAAGTALESSSPALAALGSESLEVAMTLHTTTERPPPLGPLPRRRSRRMALVAIAAVAVVGISAGVWALLTRDRAPAPLPPDETLAPPPAPAEPRPTTAASATVPTAPPVASAALATGKVEVTSQPSMDVYWGSKLLGRTPGVFELPSGTQKLELAHRELGVSHEVTVNVVGGETARAAVRLGKAFLDVRVAPWANVRIDGRAIGATPIPTQELTEGRHTVELVNKELGKSKRVTVRLSSGERHVLRESFE